MTTITTLPPAPSRADAANFAATADTFLNALPTFGTQTNAVASEINAAAAQASAAVSLLSVDGYTGSTTTSFAVASSGSQTVTTQSGRLWTVGSTLQISSTASPANYVVGQVTAYTGASLTFTIQKSNGSGTFADWKIGLSSNYIVPNNVIANGVTVGRGTGNTSTAVGYQALLSSVADSDVAVGYQALTTPTTNVGGSVAVGYQAAKAPNGGNMVTAVGYKALTSVTSGAANTAVGNQALRDTTTGGGNVAVGNSAMSANTTGGGNIAVGDLALTSSTTAIYNVAIGTQALQTSTTGTENVAIGPQSLKNNQDGYWNGGLGRTSLYNVTSGYSNVGLGYSAGYSITTGYQNVAVGVQALYNVNSGLQNVAVGHHAMNNCLSSSSLNTAVGYNALDYYAIVSNSSCFGANTLVTGNNQVQLGDSSTTTYAYGTVQNRSDSRDKADVRPTQLGLEFIKAVKPVDYRFDMREDYRPKRPADIPEYANDDEKAAYALAMQQWREACKFSNLVHDGSKKRNRYHHGVIAQDIQELIATTGVDFGGFQDHKVSGGDDVLSIGYSEFIAPLIKAVQELAAQNAELSARIATLEAK